MRCPLMRAFPPQTSGVLMICAASMTLDTLPFGVAPIEPDPVRKELPNSSITRVLHGCEEALGELCFSGKMELQTPHFPFRVSRRVEYLRRQMEWCRRSFPISSRAVPEQSQGSTRNMQFQRSLSDVAKCAANTGNSKRYRQAILQWQSKL